MTREDMISICNTARSALPRLTDAKARGEMLLAIASALEDNSSAILAANAVDLAAAREHGISSAMTDRLTLTEERLRGIADAVREVVSLPDPLRKEYEDIRPNGLRITRYRVPIGVIAMIYEARPNVTVDAAALCLRSGNAVILRGGSEAINTNKSLVVVMRDALKPFGASDAVTLIEDTARENVNTLLTLRGYIDLVIPRGGAGLIRNVVDNAKVPVIETGAGNCHVYVHADADIDMATKIILNAKTSRPSVCNAAENLLVDAGIAEKFLPVAAQALRDAGVELRVDERAAKFIPDAVPATEDDFYREYNDLILTVGVVDGVDAAVEHINRHGTKHSEAIVTENEDAAAYFLSHVDAAAVYHNASTRFTDGGVFGMGAEIGISTQKMHVRGPFALEALTTTQYRVYGNGQIR